MMAITPYRQPWLHGGRRIMQGEATISDHEDGIEITFPGSGIYRRPQFGVPIPVGDFDNLLNTMMESAPTATIRAFGRALAKYKGPKRNLFGDGQ